MNCEGDVDLQKGSQRVLAISQTWSQAQRLWRVIFDAPLKKSGHLVDPISAVPAEPMITA
jgi:hypothetical protein